MTGKKETKKTVLIGASTNPERYAYLAVLNLLSKGYEVIPIGLKEGKIKDVEILTGLPFVEEVHTITLYISPKHQPAYYNYVLNLQPQRVIFNPGTENKEFFDLLKAKKIEVIEACTLVMLSIGNY